MAQTHHRKKHKEHLRQFQQKQDHLVSTPKRKAATIFAIVGAVVGLAISYFAAEAQWIWVVSGTVLGGVAGYLFGRNIDRSLPR